MTPHFRTRRKNETLYEFGRAVLKRCSHRKIGGFSLYDIEYPVFINILKGFVDKAKLSGKAWSDEDQSRALSVMEDWGKNSLFRFNTEQGAKDAHWTKNAHWYEVGIVVGERSHMTQVAETYRSWAVYSNSSRHIPQESQVDLINYDTSDLKQIADVGIMVALIVMRAVLDRPAEYRISHGPRTKRERILNHPVAVTISLSKPVVHVAPSGMHSGIKMPEHDVRGHERKYKSGKVVWVEGHKRGDPNITRKTTYRIVL